MALTGILNINKPAGRTSRAVVDLVERIARPARAGHAGTLDPLASGVLVICVGRATRLIEYVQRMPKSYRATFLLGRCSDTDDVEGEVAEIADAPRPTREQLDAAVTRFQGTIQQRPPSYSALKVSGRRAYELARAGQSVTLAPRSVTIHRIEVERYEYPELQLEIECGSGTYVRALGRDLAAAVGTGAVMSALERSAVGGFSIGDAVTLDELTADTLPRWLQPAIVAVADLPRLELDESELAEIRHGRTIAPPAGATIGAVGSQAAQAVSTAEWAAVDSSGQLVAIVQEKRAGQLGPAKNFC
jgi:tRNA pseudouridine55 synthase